MVCTRSSKKHVVRAQAPRRANVIRCPSATTTLPPTSMRTRSKTKADHPAAAPNLEAKTKQRKTAPKKHSDLVKAVGAAFRRKQIKGRVGLLAEPWVAVGNLDPDTTESDLWEHFAHAGTIVSVSIRYSTGAIRIKKHAQAQAPGYTYALVVFATRSAAHDSLLLNGTRVGASEFEIVVESALNALPEIRRLAAIAMADAPAGTSAAPSAEAASTLITASGLTPTVDVQKTEIWSQRPEVQQQLKTRRGRKRVREWAGVEFAVTLA